MWGFAGTVVTLVLEAGNNICIEGVRVARDGDCLVARGINLGASKGGDQGLLNPAAKYSWPRIWITRRNPELFPGVLLCLVRTGNVGPGIPFDRYVYIGV